MTKMKTEEIMFHLRAAHPPTEFFYFEELRLGTGFGKDSLNRVDAFAIHYMGSKRNEVRCYEIKASRSDLLRELALPRKRRAGMRLSNRFWFVVEQGLMKIEEVPVDTGLIEVLPDGSLKELVHAPYRESIPTWMAVASILRSLDKDRLREWKEIQRYIDKDRLLQYNSLEILKRRIQELKDYKLGSKEIPDKIAEQFELAYHEILEKTKSQLFGEEDE